MWDLPGPGFKPFSPALAGRFLTTAPPGKPFLLFWMGCESGGNCWHLVDKATDAAKHPTMHRAVPIPRSKNYLAPNFNSTQVEKPCGRIIISIPATNWKMEDNQILFRLIRMVLSWLHLSSVSQVTRARGSIEWLEAKTLHWIKWFFFFSSSNQFLSHPQTSPGEECSWAELCGVQDPANRYTSFWHKLGVQINIVFMNMVFTAFSKCVHLILNTDFL